MTLEMLRTMLADGSFHHATYREIGKVWEGLFVYMKDDNGFNGFRLAGSFPHYSPDLDTAHDLVRNTGVSVGSFGRG